MASSLAVMTDAAHLLTDVSSFLISILALKIASRPISKKMTFGWHRAGMWWIFSLKMCFCLTTTAKMMFCIREVKGVTPGLLFLWGLACTIQCCLLTRRCSLLRSEPVMTTTCSICGPNSYFLNHIVKITDNPLFKLGNPTATVMSIKLVFGVYFKRIQLT